MDSQFLVRAATVYHHETALDNQTEMFVYIWSALSGEEKEQALEIWTADRQKQSSDHSIPQPGIDLIKEFEGYAERLGDGRARAYPDPIHSWDVATIGYGTTKYPDGRRVKKGDIVTPVEAEEYLIWDVDHLSRPALEQIPTWGQMNDHQRSAIFSFAYNLGAYFYGGSNFQSITRVCNSPHRWDDHEWVKEQFVKYRNPGTAAEAGLRRRRIAEAKLFCTPL